MYLIRAAVIILSCLVCFTACVPYHPYNHSVAGWDTQDTYWRSHYVSEPYYVNGARYEVYQPAYRYGIESYNRYHGRPFKELNDSELRANWESTHAHDTNLDWAHAREAAQSAYNRMDQYGNYHGTGNEHWHH